MKNIIILLVVFFLAINVFAQNDDKKSRKEIKAEHAAAQKAKIEKIVDSKNFKFVPQSASPTNGRLIPVSTYYLQVNGDNLVSYLPYYGRAYSPSVNNTSSPLNFKGTIENYEKIEKKKKDQIKFSVKNDGENLTYTLEIFDNGSASLDVQSVRRQPISFNGNIEEIK
jgi:hypothetical protein